eukprot:SAG11_NODE_503_length_8890_cov_30.658628_8_plen_195_part_00
MHHLWRTYHGQLLSNRCGKSSCRRRSTWCNRPSRPAITLSKKLGLARSCTSLCHSCARFASADKLISTNPSDAECHEQHRVNTADKCLICSEPILDRFFSVDEGKIHAEGDCMDKHRENTADKCYICNGPILARYFTVDEGKVHGEGDCMDKHREAKAPKCLMCQGPILGSHYPVDEGKVHAGAILSPAHGVCM